MANVTTVEVQHSQSGQLSYSPGQVVGYSIRETAGARAVVRIIDGAAGDSTRLLLTISLAAGESARDWFRPDGIPFNTGLYIEVVSGQIEGSVQIITGGQQ